MNEFLEKYGYFIYNSGKNQIFIIRKADNYGCIHILFVLVLIPTVVFTIFLSWQFSFALAGLLFFYFMEIDKRKKHANKTVLDFKEKKFLVYKKDKIAETHLFSDVVSVISTSSHIGGYASSERETTEEYRREVNVIFMTGETLTVFSIVSDFEDDEPEVVSLINWLEKVTKTRKSHS